MNLTDFIKKSECYQSLIMIDVLSSSKYNYSGVQYSSYISM